MKNLIFSIVIIYSVLIISCVGAPDKSNLGSDLMLSDVPVLNAPLLKKGLKTKEAYLSAIEDNEILKVEWDIDRREEPEWVALYSRQNAFYNTRKVKLIGDLARKYPDTEELEDLLLERFELSINVWNLDIKTEIEDYETKYSDNSEDIQTAWYWYAYNIIRKNNHKEEPVMQAIDNFKDRYPVSERILALYKLGVQYLNGLPGAVTLNKLIVDEFPNSQDAERAAKEKKLAESVGKEFVLSFKDRLSGKQINISDLRGKVVVIDFWATWCGPCVGEMPEMKRLYGKYKPQGVEFIGISLDKRSQTLRTYCTENGITWPQYCEEGKDWNTKISLEWGISSIPRVFILDKEGKIYSVEARGKLNKLIPELL
jgi:thiol-disulfide isomerase/thioredoxin